MKSDNLILHKNLHHHPLPLAILDVMESEHSTHGRSVPFFNLRYADKKTALLITCSADVTSTTQEVCWLQDPFQC